VASYLKDLMTRLFFLTLLIVLTISVNGQVIDNKIQKQVDRLKHQNVDSFLIYSLSCNGGLISLDTCAYEATQYLFWVKDKSCFIKRFDYCRSYKVVLLDRVSPLSFYFTYKNQIDKEELKMPTYVQSKKGNITTTITTTVDHACFYEMTFQIKSKSIIKRVSDFNLTFKEFDNGKKNLYYDFNQNTKLKALTDQITELIGKLNASNKFESE